MTFEQKIMAAIVRLDMFLVRAWPFLCGILIGILFLCLWIIFTGIRDRHLRNHRSQ